MRVLVLNAPYFPKFSRPQRSPAVTKSGTVYYPMWLAYAVGVLEQRGHEVDFIDAPVNDISLDDICRKAKERDYGLAVIDTSTPSINADLAAARALKQNSPGTFVLLVGPHVSALPESTLSSCTQVDAAALAEYDYTVADVADALGAGEAVGTVPGIITRDGNTSKRTDTRSHIDNLDELPFVSRVYRKHLDPRHYFNPNARYPNVTLVTGRGCPYQCSFCVYPQTMTGNRYRLRSVDNVIAEIEYVLGAFPEMREIFFEDDTLTANRKRCAALCEEIVSRKMKFGWVANSRADLDYETMALMHKSGCRELCVGFESGNQFMLEEMNKSMSVDKELRFMADARRAGILIHGCFMVGFPGETSETMENTLAHAIRLSPDTAQFYPVMVYPGTRAYNDFKKRGWIVTDDFDQWLTSKGLHNCVTRSGDLSPSELVEFCDSSRRRFYLRPGYIAYKAGQVIRHPSEFARTMKAFRTFALHLLKGSQHNVD